MIPWLQSGKAKRKSESGKRGNRRGKAEIGKRKAKKAKREAVVKWSRLFYDLS